MSPQPHGALGEHLVAAARWRWPEIVFWLIALRRGPPVSQPLPDPHRDRAGLGCSRSRSTSILGYAGIVSLGPRRVLRHRRVFGRAARQAR